MCVTQRDHAMELRQEATFINIPNHGLVNCSHVIKVVI